MRVLPWIVWACVAGLVITGAVQADERQWVGRFSQGDLQDWTPQVFSGSTQYTLQPESAAVAALVLKAVSHGSASGLVKHQRVNLEKTPFLQWRWKVAKGLTIGDERLKQGDDYAARVYVIVDGGFFPWKTMALNYVWSHGVEKGASWGNAYAPDQSKMLSLRSREARMGQWYEESRNVQADFLQLFGQSVTSIDVVAIMTDTDNQKGQAETYYGDMVFSAQPSLLGKVICCNNKRNHDD